MVGRSRAEPLGPVPVGRRTNSGASANRANTADKVGETEGTRPIASGMALPRYARGVGPDAPPVRSCGFRGHMPAFYQMGDIFTNVYIFI